MSGQDKRLTFEIKEINIILLENSHTEKVEALPLSDSISGLQKTSIPHLSGSLAHILAVLVTILWLFR